MVAAAAPAGVATQGVLTFSGAQGIGKTTWIMRLMPRKLDVILTGHTLDTKNKDSVYLALSNLICELGELDATMRKSDIAALKAFVTQQEDKLRRPYMAKESEFVRRTSFCATVNGRYQPPLLCWMTHLTCSRSGLRFIRFTKPVRRTT